VLPAKACTGAARDVLGETDCAPIGDCTATFPPADATVTVDPLASGGGSTYTKIQAALDAAPDGAVIAVSPGTYPEALSFDRDVSLRLVGRCARDVIVAPKTDDFSLAVGGKLTVRGMTFRGGNGVVAAGTDATLALEDSMVDGAAGQGASASKGTLRLTRSAVRHVTPTGDGPAFGLFAVTGAHLAIEDSVVDSLAGVGAYATDDRTVIRMTRSVIRDIATVGMVRDAFGIDTQARLEFVESAVVGPVRHALMLQKNASASFERSTIWHVEHGGDDDPGVSLDVEESEVTTEDFTMADAAGLGVSVQTPRGKGTLRRTAFIGPDRGTTDARGLGVAEGSTLRVDDSVIARANGISAIVSERGLLEISGSLVVDSHGKADAMFPIAVTNGGALVAKRTTIANCDGSAVTASGDATTIDLDEVLVRQVATKPIFGVGVYLSDGSVGTLTRTIIDRADGVALVGSASSASFVSGTLRANTVAVQAQRGSKILEAEAPAESLEIAISKKVRFIDNATRVGLGELPLPAVPSL
jgi:hypothetical protein